MVTKVIADACSRGIESSKGFAPKSDSPVIQTVKKDKEIKVEDEDNTKKPSNEPKEDTSNEEEKVAEVESEPEDSNIEEVSEETPSEDATDKED